MLLKLKKSSHSRSICVTSTVSAALTKVQAAQTKIDQAKALLQDKADNSELVTAKNNLQAAVDQVPSTDGMTQQSIDNYNTSNKWLK